MVWRGAREKGHHFFSIFFIALTDKDVGNVALVCSSSLCFFFSLFFLVHSFLFVSFSVHSRILTFGHSVLLGGFVSTCRFIQRHSVALESDINIYKSLLLPMHEHDQEHTSQRQVPQRDSVFAPPPRKMPKLNIDLLCA